MLLRGVFDTLEEGAYISEADDYLQLLQSRVWPLLGVSASMHNSCFAWVHFRQVRGSAVGCCFWAVRGRFSVSCVRDLEDKRASFL